MGGGLYGDASGREWEVEVVANSTGAQTTRRLGPVILKLVINIVSNKKKHDYIKKKTHLGPKRRVSHRLGLFS